MSDVRERLTAELTDARRALRDAVTVEQFYRDKIAVVGAKLRQAKTAADTAADLVAMLEIQLEGAGK